jgi:hypothetical protein
MRTRSPERRPASQAAAGSASRSNTCIRAGRGRPAWKASRAPHRSNRIRPDPRPRPHTRASTVRSTPARLRQRADSSRRHARPRAPADAKRRSAQPALSRGWRAARSPPARAHRHAARAAPVEIQPHSAAAIPPIWKRASRGSRREDKPRPRDRGRREHTAARALAPWAALAGRAWDQCRVRSERRLELVRMRRT